MRHVTRIEQDVARLGVELGQGEARKAAEVRLGARDRAALDARVHRRPGIGRPGVRGQDVETQLEGGPGALVEQAAVEVRVAELGISALQIGPRHDAEVAGSGEA